MPKFVNELVATPKKTRAAAVKNLLEAIARKNINLDGYGEFGGAVHLLSPDSKSARRVLKSAGFKVTEQKVLVLETQNHPGGALGLFKEINSTKSVIDFVYYLSDHRIAVGSREAQRISKLVLNKQLKDSKKLSRPR